MARKRGSKDYPLSIKLQAIRLWEEKEPNEVRCMQGWAAIANSSISNSSFLNLDRDI